MLAPWCLLAGQKHGFSLTPASVEFLLKLEAVGNKIVGAAGSPNLLLQVNGAWVP